MNIVTSLFAVALTSTLLSRTAVHLSAPPRDLNKNGKVDPYEDPKQPIETRITNLLGLMTVEEKAGMMFINGTVINDDGSIDKKPGGQGPAAPDAQCHREYD